VNARRHSRGNGNPVILLATVVLLVVICLILRSHVDKPGDDLSRLPETAIVTVVYDGDTIRITAGRHFEKKLRLLGIDTPELSDSREEVLFKAHIAKRFSFIHLYRQKVKLTYDWPIEDRYGRILAYVWTEKTGLFNRFILEKGFASVFRKYPVKYQKEFLRAERKARQEHQGFWSDGDYPIIPAERAKNHLGELFSVRFFCIETVLSNKFLYLKGKHFSALIPVRYLDAFQKVEKYRGRYLTVTGLIEEYKGQPQIMIFLPHQIRRKGNSQGRLRPREKREKVKARKII
jgi:micrococcal nuclease